MPRGPKGEKRPAAVQARIAGLPRLIKRSPLRRRKAPLFGRRKFFERKLAQARRVAHSGLRNLHDRFRDSLCGRVRSIRSQCAQRRLIRRHDAVYIVRTERRMLQ